MVLRLEIRSDGFKYRNLGGVALGVVPTGGFALGLLAFGGLVLGIVAIGGIALSIQATRNE